MALAYDDMDFDYTDDGDYSYNNEMWTGPEDDAVLDQLIANKIIPNENKNAASEDDVEIDFISGSEYVTNDASIKTVLLKK